MSASKTALSVVLTATVLALTACGNPPAQSPRPDASVETPPSLPSQNAAVADANTLFSARCSFCHGTVRGYFDWFKEQDGRLDSKGLFIQPY